MKDANCIFCRIANGEIPSDTLYEDDDFRVILDLNPASKGHALVLPKNHYQDLFSLEEETGAKALGVAKKVGLALKTALKADGINLVQNNGAAAGQTVMHFHIHIIPRYEGEEEIVSWTPAPSNPAVQKEIVQAVKALL